MEVFQTKTKRITLTHTHYIIISIVSAMVFVGLVAVVMGGKSPQPTIVSVDAGVQPLSEAVVIDFDWPIARDVEVSISPQVFGTVGYGEAVIRDQLVRSLTFTPEITWLPDTTYEITLHSVHGAVPSFTEPTDYALSFHTPPAPIVAGITPSTAEPIRADAAWIMTLNQPIQPTSAWSVAFEPAIEFDMVAGSDQRSYVITPKSKLSQGGSYTMTVSQQRLRYLFGTEEVAVRTDPTVVTHDTWIVREAPGIEAFAPQGASVALDESITITFSENIDLASLEKFVTFDPALEGKWSTTDYRTVTYTPTTLARDTTYAVILAEGLPTFSGGYLPESARHTFTTIGPVRVTSASPADRATGVSVNTVLRFGFNQAVDQASIAGKVSLSPAGDGGISWEGNTILFTPGKPLDFNTTYTVTIAAGVDGISGFPLESAYATAFTTELSVTKLGVVYDRQDHNLSCEVATLKMALNYFGANVGEQALIDAIGFDPTPKSNGVWGDPYEAFVGDIDGHQPSTGYGVYWDPIAAAGAKYRTTRAFTGGELGHLIGEIQKGHPIVIWGTAGSGTRIDWKTPAGKDIVAVNGEHTFVVTGFVGSAAAPTKIIVMDPLSGERYLSLDHFLWMWGLLGNSGVVVE